MRLPLRSVAVAAALLFSLAFSPAHEAAAQVNRPPCRKVMREVNREVTERGGLQASPRAVARRIGVEPAWVLRCMEAHGRVPSRQWQSTEEEREAFERAVEEGRSVEVDQDDPEVVYDQQQRLKQEKKELRDRQRELAKEEKKFDQSSDPFFPMVEY